MNFKVGDRVAVYTTAGGKGFRLVRKIQTIQSNGMIFDGELVVHPKQCRLLKKKKRRRVWVEFFSKLILTAPERLPAEVLTIIR